MGQLSLSFKQRLGDILRGSQTTNLSITKFQFGTGNTTAEDESNTGLESATGNTRNVDSQSRANKIITLSAFFANGSFGAVTLKEVAAFFGDNVLAMRDTTNDVLPIANANLLDIRVDLTIDIEQA